jgi:hypothetical protein
VDMGFNAKLFKEKMEIDLSVDNLLINYFDANINYLNQNILVGSRWEPRVFTLTVKYKFGNQFMKETKKVKSSAEEEAKRANQKS